MPTGPTGGAVARLFDYRVLGQHRGQVHDGGERVAQRLVLSPPASHWPTTARKPKIYQNDIKKTKLYTHILQEKV